MKMKFNFGILKDKVVRFEYEQDERMIGCYGKITKIKEKKGTYKFTFASGAVLELKDTVLSKMIIRKDNDQIVFTYSKESNMLSGLIGFSMADTYGFPLEITKEILDEDGFVLDVEGYNVLKELQKEKSSGTFVNKDGWNSK